MHQRLTIAALGILFAAGSLLAAAGTPALADPDDAQHHHAIKDIDGHYGQHWSNGRWVPNNGNGWHDGKHYAYGVYDNNGHRIVRNDHDRDDRKRHHHHHPDRDPR